MPEPHEMAALAAAMNVSTWLATERADYAQADKWARIGADVRGPVAPLIEAGGDSTIEALDFVRMYLHRAQQLGIETPNGRQALGKAIVTAQQALGAAVQYHGPMPAPARPSGEIEPWHRD